MEEKFYSLVTNAGKAKIANCNVLGTKLNLTKFKLGDSNGSYYTPTETQEDLKNVVYEGNITSLRVDVDNPSFIIAETFVPANVGGFYVREGGLYDDDGILIAVCKYPETHKPSISSGAAKDLFFKMFFEVSNTESVNIKIDPTITLATKKDIESIKKDFNDLSDKVDKIKIDAGKQSIIIEGVSIVPNFEASNYDSVTGYYYQDIIISGKEADFTNKSIVNVYPQINYLESAALKTLLPITNCFNGYFRIYSKKQFTNTDSVKVDISILKGAE